MLYTKIKPDEVQKEYEWALKNLDAIAKNELTLQCADGTPVGADASAGGPLYAFDCARFDCAGIAGFRFDAPNAQGCGCTGAASGCSCTQCCTVSN